MRRAAALAVAVLLAAAPVLAQTGHAGHGPAVSIVYAAYLPAHLDVVAGETVTWTQDSVRVHTVTADDASFDSGRLYAGDTFARAYPETGTFSYHCRLHAGIVGEVAVHDVVLDPVTRAAAPGRPFPLRGRAAAGIASVTIDGDDGSHVVAPVGEDGTFAASVTPATTTTYRAADSPPVTLRVLDRTVTVHVGRSGRDFAVAAVVSPPAPHGTVVLELRLRARFGWWPVGVRRLGKDSAATLRVHRVGRVRARVVHTLPDGATVLAVSRVFHVGTPRPRMRHGST